MLIAAVAALGFLASGCYTFQAEWAEDHAQPVPWFCDPVAPNSVTGPGMGSTNWYAGMERAPLNYADCKGNATLFDQAKAYAEQFPTLGDAQAAGMHNSFDFIPGMGTHTGYGVTPELMADPGFDVNDPVIPGSNNDTIFDPAEPEYLQYNGNTPGSVLIGMSYYVRTTNGLPPEGFAGDNDYWHHHPTLCTNPSTGVAFGANTTDQGCADSGGVNLHMQNYYMLHVWLVDDIEYVADVHAPMHPCIVSGGAIFDMSDPCHRSAIGGTSAGVSATSDRAKAAKEEAFYCPIGSLSA
jgi:hypothetical protein